MMVKSSATMQRYRWLLSAVIVTGIAFLAVSLRGQTAVAGGPTPTLLVDDLAIRVVARGLDMPTSMAFIGSKDLLVLEKATGRVQRITNGIMAGAVLDLAVNSASERGLLGIALHPAFPSNPGVYLFYTESASGEDTTDLSDTNLLGNRVARFNWDGAALYFDRPIIDLRARQRDPGQPERGNHDGGVLRFGPDGKLYIYMGDNGRRGQMQNLICGWSGDCALADDESGGPEPDHAHLTGVILRLNDDGSAPADNPFYAVGAIMGGDVGSAVQKIFSYGHRNSFGMDFDPQTGQLWIQENGDDTFSEMNRVEAGMNGGWVQIMGPIDRVAQYRELETNPPYVGLQQNRWPPTNISESPAAALGQLFMLPGAFYHDPEFSWTHEVAPAGIAFISSAALGPQYQGDLFVGASRPFLEGGYLFRFRLTPDRMSFAFDDPRLADRVADNLGKHEITESESLLIGRDFGVITDMQIAPNGNLYLVSLLDGTIYEIYRPSPLSAGRWNLNRPIQFPP